MLSNVCSVNFKLYFSTKNINSLTAYCIVFSFLQSTLTFEFNQILIYRYVLSPVSPLYYSVACNAGVGQSPYPFIGRGFYSRQLFRFKAFITAGASPRPTLRFHYNTNRQRKQVPCRNWFVGAIHESPLQVNILMRRRLRLPFLFTFLSPSGA